MSGETTRRNPDAAEVFGRYVREAEIGRGGFSTVYRAVDRELGRPVALKLLEAKDPEDIARFKREAMLAASLAHPNIAQIYEVGEARGRMFLAMQLIEGVSAGDRPHDAPRAAAIVRDAARAVHHAHGFGIVHRDLKPENLMLDATGRVFVMDFGLAKRLDTKSSISLTGSVMGTPVYMPPEQARGSPHLDARADVYSLGATLYRLVSGERPFDGQTAYEIVHKVIESEPAPLPPAIPADLRTIVAKAMSKEPARRYASAAELADDLDRFLNGEAIAARPATIVYRLTKRVRRNPWAWGIGATALAGAVLFALLYREQSLSADARRAIDAADRAIFEWRTERYMPVHDVTPARQKLEGALEQLDRAIGIQGEAHELLAMKGWALRELGRVEEALPLLERAVEAAPREGSYHWWLSQALQDRADRLAIESHLQTQPADRAAVRARGVEIGNRSKDEARLAAAAPDWKAEPYLKDYVSALDQWSRGEAEAARQTCERIGRSYPRGGEEGWMLLARFSASDDERLGPVQEAARLAPSWAKPLQMLSSLRSRSAEALAEDDDTTPEKIVGTLEAAALCADLAVEIDPTDPASWYARVGAASAASMIAFERGQDASAPLDAAIAGSERVIEMAPRWPPGWIQRCTLRGNQAHMRAERGEDVIALYREVLDRDYARVLELMPDHPLVLANRGLCRANLAIMLMNAGVDPTPEFTAALDDFAGAIAADDRFVHPHLHRGFARIAWSSFLNRTGGDAGDLLRAAVEEDLARAVALDPDAADGYRCLGMARTVQAETAADPIPLLRRAVEEDFERALLIEDGSAFAHLLRGSARTEWARAVQHAGGDPIPLYRAAIDQDFAKSLELNPASAEAWLRIGEARVNLGVVTAAAGGDPTELFRRALEVDFERARELNPRMASLWVRIGVALANQGQWEIQQGGDPMPFLRRALEEAFAQAVEMNPTFAEVHYRIGLTWKETAIEYARRGDPSRERDAGRRAEAAFTRAIELHPRYLEAYYERGGVRFVHGPAAGAVEDFRRAIELNPLLEAELGPIIRELEEF